MQRTAVLLLLSHLWRRGLGVTPVRKSRSMPACSPTAHSYRPLPSWLHTRPALTPLLRQIPRGQTVLGKLTTALPERRLRRLGTSFAATTDHPGSRVTAARGAAVVSLASDPGLGCCSGGKDSVGCRAGGSDPESERAEVHCVLSPEHQASPQHPPVPCGRRTLCAPSWEGKIRGYRNSKQGARAPQRTRLLPLCE